MILGSGQKPLMENLCRKVDGNMKKYIRQEIEVTEYEGFRLNGELLQPLITSLASQYKIC